MSSRIEVQKICEFCGQPFMARTLVTRFCSQRCNSRNYKQRFREEKLKVHNAIQINVASPGEVINNIAQEYFELPEAARIMRVSKRTLFRLISERKLKSKKVLRRTLILKEDIKLFFAIQ